MAAERFYPWHRYWVKEGDIPVLQNGLFVEPTSEMRWFGPSSNGLSLSEVADVPCLVLLGDVGMGKSRVIEAEAMSLKRASESPKHAVVYHDLKRLSEAHIQNRVFRDPLVEAWARGSHSLTLFLDSLDECWRRIEALEVLIADELATRMRATTTLPLYLRITCRAAEWRVDAGKALERLFPKRHNEKAQVQTLVLAPLSAKNVRDAAVANEIDGDRLIQRITDKGAQILASHPITLEMLLQIYREQGDFPKSRVELYREGCLRLTADDHIVLPSTQQRKTTPKHRLAIAGRLAALSIFTNRLLINGDTERPLNRVDVLETTEAFGYVSERTAGESVVVDRDRITETLQTGLFGERIDGAQIWRHQSYAEFLSAEYLRERGLAKTQIVSLLCDTENNTQRIIPQLEETACWMAEVNPEIFGALAQTNADIFLRSDSTYWHDAHRSLLVQSYLDLVRAHRVTTLDWQLKYRFARLAHATLATQLSPVIKNRKDNPLAREMAIDIAAYCKLTSVAADLIEIFLDPNDVFRVRKHAGFALKEIADDDIRDSLKQQNFHDWSGDIDDDLKGHYLQTLWPSHISVVEILPLLTPKRRNYTGSYRMFLEYDLPGKLLETDLPLLLNWFTDKGESFDTLGDFGYLPTKLLSRALTRMDEPPIRDAVLRLFSNAKDDFYRTLRSAIRLENNSPKIRLMFWSAIVETDLDISELISYGDIANAGLLQAEDLPLFLNRYKDSTGQPSALRWATLVFSVFRLEDAAALDLLCEVARADDTLKLILESHTSWRIPPENRNGWKREYEASRERRRLEEETQKSFAELMNGALAEFESGRLKAYCTVSDLLDREPDNLGRINLTLRFSEDNAWRKLDPHSQRRILDGAVVYLRGISVQETKAWDTEQRYCAYDVINPALVLLFDQAPQTLESLTGDDWAKWIGVFLSYSARRNRRHDEAYQRIIFLAFSKARKQTLAALERYCKTCINNDTERGIVWNLKDIWCDDVKQIFLNLLQTEALTQSAAQDLFQLFVTNEPQEADDRLASYVEQIDGQDHCSIYVPGAMVALMTSDPSRWAGPLLGRIRAEPSLGRAFVRHLLRTSRHEGSWPDKMSPRHLIQFWEWLNQCYPGDPYERDNGGGNVTISHDIYHFRNAIFKTFIASGKSEAIEIMVELMKQRPNDFWLGDVLAQMRKTVHRLSWVRPSPSALMQIFAQKEKRLIRTAGELHAVVVESLRRFEDQLHGTPPSTELWNESTEGKVTNAQPKDEMNLSNRLKCFLEADLAARGIVANREVQIKRRFGEDAAQLVDLLIQAVTADESGTPGPIVDIVLEVKCAWNKDVLLDMEQQLFNRYLNNAEMHFGIYLVAYFTCSAWKWTNDSRNKSGESTTPIDELRRKLSIQAATLSSSEKLITSVVLDARLTTEDWFLAVFSGMGFSAWRRLNRAWR